jgi:hypothetical protein
MPRPQRLEAGISTGVTTDAPILGTTDGGLRFRQRQREKPKPKWIRGYLSENPASVTGRSWSDQFESGYEPPVDDTPRLVVYLETNPPLVRWEK